MDFKKYEDLIQKFNEEILSWNFDFEQNKDILENILDIYKNIKQKKFSEVLSLISKVCYENQKYDNLKPLSPSPSRAWEIEKQNQEENIEAFNSIEMLTWLFLQNLKENLWNQKSN